MSHLPDLPANICVFYGVVATVLAITITLVSKLSLGSDLNAIPTVGSSSWLSSWWAGFKYLTNARGVLQEGYEKYKAQGVPFKVAELHRWTVILSTREHVEELARATNVFSLMDAINDDIQIECLLGREVYHDPYHIPVIRRHLARYLESLYPEIRDEIATSFTELLDLRGNEWKNVPALSIIQKVTCRTSNRVFVSLPLCRDPDWIDLNIRCTVDMVAGSVITGVFPKFMRPFVAQLFTKVPHCIKRGEKLLGPIVRERQKYLDEYGSEWDGKPNDLLSSLMDEAKGPDLATEKLTVRMLICNFAAVHTSSNSFTQALFYLAANPRFIQPLRKEVEDTVKKEGWSKAAVSKMRKIDSFLKETLRLEGMSTTSLTRKALSDFTFADGTFIQKGTTVLAPTLSFQHDENFYDNPDVFKPFRFAEMHDEEGTRSKCQYTSTSAEYLAFGHGKHACPGRFLAASELKLMLAHVVVTYDVKMEDATHPPSWHIGTFISANPHAKVMFRNRLD